MPDYSTPAGQLHSAIIDGDFQKAKRILEGGGAVKASTSFDGWTMATCAAQFNQVRILRELLAPRLQPKQLGASKRGQDGTGPAHQAALNSHLEILKVLAEFGADLSEERADGNSPINLAKGECEKFLENWLEEKQKPISKTRVATSKERGTKTTTAPKTTAKKAKKEKVAKTATKTRATPRFKKIKLFPCPEELSSNTEAVIIKKATKKKRKTTPRFKKFKLFPCPQ